MNYINLNEMRKLAGLPLKEDYDAKKTSTEAMALVKKLKGQFDVSVDDKTNSDGSITITLNNGSLAPESEAGNPNILTAKNLSKAVDDLFREYRAKGWMFSQPVRGSFTIGVAQ